VINFIYIFLLTIFYDQINLIFDYLIIFLLINFIVISSISYKKSSTRDLILIILTSLVIDFIAFNYIFSFYLSILIPIIFLNYVIDRYSLTKTIISFISFIFSILTLIILNMNFYLQLHVLEIIILTILILSTNLLILRMNEFKLR
jgi:hypothetical protein